MRFLGLLFCCVIALGQVLQAKENKQHITFSLVHGSVGFVSNSGGAMTDAPHTVLSFSGTDGHNTLVLVDTTGDYVAVLRPGHYSVLAYDVKTGNLISLDSRQLSEIEVLPGKDDRLDVMLVQGRKQ